MCSEFSTSSQASADSALALSKRADLKLSRSAKLSHSPAASSPVTGPTCPVMTTCKPSPQSDLLPMALPLMSSAAGFPAKTSAQPERAQGLPVSDPASGQRLPDWLANYDPATSSWRTSQLCLDGALEPYSETWPRSGMTRSGIAYRLPPLVPLTAGTEFGSWLTPRASDFKGSASPQSASGAVRRQGRPTNLPEMVQLVSHRMWPTPTRHNAQETAAPSEYLRNTPTLAAQAGGALNPTWVEWLMGFPLGWTDLKASATPSSPKSPNSSATPSSKRKRAANPIQPGE